MNISLIGYRGAGKTTLGKLVAKKLKMDFIDIDRLIEQELSVNIKEFFAQEGEKEFRKIEAKKVREVLDHCSNSIIAHGGGVILDPKNIFNIKSRSKVIFLDADEKTILERINNSMRPALTKLSLEEEIHQTLRERLPLYHKCADTAVQLNNSTKNEQLEILLKAIEPKEEVFVSKRIQFRSKKLNDYSILIRRGLFKDLGKIINLGNRYVIITDSNVKEIYANDLKSFFKLEGKECSIISFPAGEEHKNLQTFSDLHEQIDLSLDRKSCIVALGGGVTGDIAGFVASTYMRGISYVQVPTSLLAMVDSSIGGKLGVNTSKGKNCVGVFSNPQRVYIDPLTLVTLPRTSFIEGLAEAIKHGIIKSKHYFNFIHNNSSCIHSLDSLIITKLIHGSIGIKLSFVKNDEKESDKRRILNFGHTIGHTLEEVIGYGNLTHGSAVGIGMVAAAYISLLKRMIDEQAFLIIENAISSLDLPVSLNALNFKCDPDLVYNSLKRDKKSVSGKINFVLLKGIGKAVIRSDVTKQEILGALEYVS